MNGHGFIVSGGTGALGAEVVAAIVGRGGRVAVPYRGEQGWLALRDRFDAAAVWGQATDVSHPAEVTRFVTAAAGWLGRLDGVAAVAGAYRGSGPLETAAPDEWDAMLRGNLSSVHALCRAALPHLLLRGGAIVTVSSRLARSGGDGALAYAVAKAGVEALTRVLALENRSRGVRVNAVAPGTIDTAGNRQAMPTADASAWTPPQAIASVIAFLLSSDSAPVTGAVVPVDARA